MGYFIKWSWEGLLLEFRLKLNYSKEAGASACLNIVKKWDNSEKVHWYIGNFYLGNERIKVGVD